MDTGFIVYNDRNYPRFERLLKVLGVATQPSNMSFSVSDGKGDFEYSGASPNGLFANRRHLARPSFHRMILDLLRFNREAPALIGLNGEGPSLGRFLDEGGYSREFVERLIVPQASAVWSADPTQMWSFPASLLAEFFAQPRHVRPAPAGPTGGRSPAARATTWRRSSRRSATACGCRRRSGGSSASTTASS